MSLKPLDALVINKIGTPAKKLEFCVNFIYPIIPQRAVLDDVRQRKKRKKKKDSKCTEKNYGLDYVKQKYMKSDSAVNHVLQCLIQT